MKPIVTDIEFMRISCRPTTYEEVRDLDLRQKLIDSIDNGYHEGIGLAANQIGFDVRYAIYLPSRIKTGRTRRPVCLMNPKIIGCFNLLPFPEEGCLSMPYKHFNTWRYQRIIFENIEGDQTVKYDVSGLEAVVVQHEIDHMDGVLAMDRIRKPMVPGPNDNCACGSGKKFKKCHGG